MRDEADDKPSAGVLLDVFLPPGDHVAVAGPVPAAHLLGSALGAHVRHHNQERPSARL